MVMLYEETMYSAALFLLSDYSTCGIAREPEGLEARIVGGKESPEGKWRWQAGLFFGSGFDTLAEKIQHVSPWECMHVYRKKQNLL